MSNKRGRKSAFNMPQRRPVVLLGMSDSGTAIFQCTDCGGVHIRQFDPEMVEAIDTENEERPHRTSATPHDHSLELATESNSANPI